MTGGAQIVERAVKEAQPFLRLVPFTNPSTVGLTALVEVLGGYCDAPPSSPRLETLSTQAEEQAQRRFRSTDERRAVCSREEPPPASV